MTAAAADQAASVSSVDSSLWWDSFVDLFDNLDGASLSSDLPAILEHKLKSNHSWFLDLVARFKPPNEASKLALNSRQISIGTHVLDIKPELKEATLRLSECVGLDEVQSYILLSRSYNTHKFVLGTEGQEQLNFMVLQYYLERQCLLKSIRHIFICALSNGNGSNSSDLIRKEAQQLIDNGFEKNILSYLQNLFPSVSLENTDTNFEILWLEENLIEGNLVLDVLFLCYYESSCICSIMKWKQICSIFKGLLVNSYGVTKLAVSIDARQLLRQAKARLLLILIETIDLDNLLHLVHDEVPFSQGASVFTLSDVQEIDSMVSTLHALDAVEAGPLVLAWAVFLCLLLTLPLSKENSVLTEIDHAGHVAQAFEAAPFNYLLQILRDNTFKDSDGPVPGFLSVLRTLISSFIASYELTQQIEDYTLNLIIDILCHLYPEESLSVQFWDRESFIDGPIRSLLYMLENEFPFRTFELLRLLTSLCEGSWSAECVYNFLNKMNGITTVLAIPEASHKVTGHYVVITCDLEIPGFEGLLIPSGTTGTILKYIDTDRALVRWKCPYSGIVLLIVRLAQGTCLNCPDELFVTLNLLFKMVSFNKIVCFNLLNMDKTFVNNDAHHSGHTASYVRVDIINILCALLVNLVQDATNSSVVSICIEILAKLLKCLPSNALGVVSRMNIFGTEDNNLSSGVSSLSGRFSRVLIKDSGEVTEDFCLISVLDFAMQLVEIGAKDSVVTGLVVFSLHYVLVNRIQWGYKFSSSGWKMTLKVFELMKSCIKVMHLPHNFAIVVRDILLNDFSVHNVLCHVMCISANYLEKLCACCLYDSKEIEGIQLTVCSAYNIAYGILSAIAEDNLSSLSSLIQMMLSPAMKPMPLVTAAASLTSYHHSMEIQMAAVKLLSMLCFISSRLQPSEFECVSPNNDSLQIEELRSAMFVILCDDAGEKEDLVVEIINLLTSAAKYQPAFLLGMINAEEEMEGQENSVSDIKGRSTTLPNTDSLAPEKANCLKPILNIIKTSQVYLRRLPRVLLGVLSLLKALWQGGMLYSCILKKMRSSEMFWQNLSSLLSIESNIEALKNNSQDDDYICEGYRFLCKAAVLEVMSHEIYFQKRLTDANTHGDLVENKLITANMLPFRCEIADSLIRSFSMSGYDNVIIGRSKAVVAMFVVHVIHKILTGGPASLSITAVDKIQNIAKKLIDHPAFATLVAQYVLRGYSEGNESTHLVLNDLYYHINGQLEGRDMSPGPFKELFVFLLELHPFESNHCIKESVVWPADMDKYVFDIVGLKNELQLELWDYSDWKESKKFAIRALSQMHETNMMMFFADSKHLALKAMITFLSVYEGNMTEKNKSFFGNSLPEPAITSRIKHVCKCLQMTTESSCGNTNPQEYEMKLLSCQAELLLCLSRSALSHARWTDVSGDSDVSALLIRSSFLGLSFLSGAISSSSTLIQTVKMLLLLLLTWVKFSCGTEDLTDKSDEVEHLSEASLCCFASLPVLCKYVSSDEYCNLAVACLDVIIKNMATKTWLPLLQKHLDLQFLVRKIQQKDHITSILSLFLTLARAREGVEMLRSANLFSSLKSLLDQLSPHGHPSNKFDISNGCEIVSIDDGCMHILGIVLAILSSSIHSLRDKCYCFDIVDSIMCHLSERAPTMLGFLSSLSLPDDDRDKKRARTPRTELSLTALRETEHTLVLICLLVKYRVSWSKAMKDVESQLREAGIHVLASISKAIQRTGDASYCRLSTLFLPSSKEEFGYNRRPSFVNSNHGWFSNSALDLSHMANVHPELELPVVVKDQTCLKTSSSHQTQFSDMVAIQIYRIALLLLRFLCIQAQAAVTRAEEVEFIDPFNFPELPMPEILHGLQDQAIYIVLDLCKASTPGAIPDQLDAIVRLLLQVLEKSLYLELCVLQSCGIRPTLGHTKDFSTAIGSMMEVLEQHTSFKAYARSLMRTIEQLYPGLLAHITNTSGISTPI